MEEHDELLRLQNKLRELERRHDDRVKGLLADDIEEELNIIAEIEKKNKTISKPLQTLTPVIETVESGHEDDDLAAESLETLPQRSPIVNVNQRDEFLSKNENLPAIKTTEENITPDADQRSDEISTPVESTALVDPDSGMQQIHEYATLLGMDLETEDSLLLHIAEEGFGTPLPDEWRWHSHEGNVYYISTVTGETTWSNPVDEQFQKKYQVARALLAAVLLELHDLEDRNWMIQLPMTSIILTASSFVDPNSFLYIHNSWGVGESEYQGEPTRITAENIPIPILKNLASCTVSPATPGMVTLDVSSNTTGAVVHRWLEVEESDVGLVVVIREHSLAPGSEDSFPQF